MDTLYIPGRHRKALMDVLALFLETDCFLEIATPTAVHLVVPPEETIQFADHVRDPALLFLQPGDLLRSGGSINLRLMRRL